MEWNKTDALYSRCTIIMRPCNIIITIDILFHYLMITVICKLLATYVEYLHCFTTFIINIVIFSYIT